MKEILFIMERLRGGGAEKALVELLKQFDYTQYKVTLCLVFLDGVYIKEVPAEVEIISFFSNESSSFKRSLERKSLRHYRKYNRKWLLHYIARHTIKQQKFDAIISYMEGYALIFHHLLYKQASRNIAWVHCDLKNYHWTLPYFKDDSCEKECYAHMDDIIFVSHNAMSAFNDLYTVDARKHCIYNIVDINKIRALAAQKEIEHAQLTITAIGSLIEVKGYDRLLRVARRLKEDGYQLQVQVIGDGINGSEQELFALHNTLELEGYVKFLGYMDSPFSYLQASDIFVSTSLAEGFSLVICEAMTLGIPIVATRTAGAMELLDENKYGLLTDHDDTSLYKALKRLIDNKELREHYKQQSLERACIFDIKQTMETIYTLL